jgi:hypothetical protein
MRVPGAPERCGHLIDGREDACGTTIGDPLGYATCDLADDVGKGMATARECGRRAPRRTCERG